MYLMSWSKLIHSPENYLYLRLTRKITLRPIHRKFLFDYRLCILLPNFLQFPWTIYIVSSFHLLPTPCYRKVKITNPLVSTKSPFSRAALAIPADLSIFFLFGAPNFWELFSDDVFVCLSVFDRDSYCFFFFWKIVLSLSLIALFFLQYAPLLLVCKSLCVLWYNFLHDFPFLRFSWAS
jgi:hypothetical protein